MSENIINTEIPVFDGAYLKLHRKKQRYPIAFYHSKYFEEPFIKQILTLQPDVNSVQLTSTAEDLNHRDLIVDVMKNVCYVDVKIPSVDFLTKELKLCIGEYVLQKKDIMIGFVCDGKIYLTDINKFNNEIKSCRCKYSKSMSGSNSQHVSEYYAKDAMFYSSYSFSIPDDLYKIYEYSLSNYRNHYYTNKQYEQNSNTEYITEYYKPYMQQLISNINDCNEIYVNYCNKPVNDVSVYTDVTDSYINDVYSMCASLGF